MQIPRAFRAPADAVIAVDRSSAIPAGGVHDDPGAALTVRSASARLAHNGFMRDGASERVRRPFDDGGNLLFTGNVFQDVSRDRIDHPRGGARAVSGRDNWFVDEARSALSTPPRIQRGR